MEPPGWMRIKEGVATDGQITLELGLDVWHEDFLPDMCDYLRAQGKRELIPALRAAHRQMVAEHNVADEKGSLP